ncbi:MAG: type II secretion system protein GspM [Brachymonas sp.]
MNELLNRWNALASRERSLVAAAAALIMVALLWWVAISPALSKLSAAREAAPKLQAQLQLMRAQASEAANLKAQRLLTYDESLRALEASVKTLGASATLSVSNERASITLKAVNADALALMLSQVRANARLVPTQVKLQKAAGAAPDATAWDGQLVLNLPAR